MYSTKICVDNYVVIDTETTGISHHDKIIELAAVKVRGNKVVDSFQQLINPMIPISYGATRVNGITNEMVENCPLFYEIEDSFLDFIQTDILIGHNINFDLCFLNKSCHYPITNPCIDTLYLARRYLKGQPDNKLCTLVKFLGIDENQEHRALSDVLLTHKLYQRLKTCI